MASHLGHDHRERWRAAGRAVARLSAGYQAKREVLEPVVRLVADVLAVMAAIAARQSRVAQRSPSSGAESELP